MNSSSTGGVGGSGSTPQPILPGLSATDMASVTPGGVEAALKTPVANMGQLKALLIQSLGEQAGTKLYNSFLTSFAMIMLQQMQDSAQHAQNAAQSSRTGTS